MELTAGGLDTPHQLGPQSRHHTTALISGTRPHVINIQDRTNQGKKDPKIACVGRAIFNLYKAGSHLQTTDTSKRTSKKRSANKYQSGALHNTELTK